MFLHHFTTSPVSASLQHGRYDDDDEPDTQLDSRRARQAIRRALGAQRRLHSFPVVESRPRDAGQHGELEQQHLAIGRAPQGGHGPSRSHALTTPVAVTSAANESAAGENARTSSATRAARLSPGMVALGSRRPRATPGCPAARCTDDMKRIVSTDTVCSRSDAPACPRVRASSRGRHKRPSRPATLLRDDATPI